MAHLVGIQKAFKLVKIDVFGAAEVVPHVHGITVLIIQRHCINRESLSSVPILGLLRLEVVEALGLQKWAAQVVQGAHR